MECPYCLGKKADLYLQTGNAERVDESVMRFDYGVDAQMWVWRFVHEKYGFKIDIHNCIDQGGWTFYMGGPWPTTRAATRRIETFIQRAWSRKKRGPAPKVQLSDLYSAVRNLPDSAKWPEILDHMVNTAGFTVTYDAVKAMLRRRGIKGGLPEVRKRAKEGYE